MNTIQNIVANILRVGLGAAAGLKWAVIGAVCLIAEAAVAQPANDNFNQFIDISPAYYPAGIYTSSNVGSTLELIEPSFLTNAPDNTATIVHSVWFQWTAPASGVVTFDTFGSDFDTVLAVYTNLFGGIDPNGPMTFNDDYIPGIVPQSIVSFNAVAGQTYAISVNGSANPLAGYTNQGDYVLEWSETTPTAPSGTFSFTYNTYTVSDRESIPPYDPARIMANVPSILGARVTVTRSGGANGRVLVPYSYWITNNENVIVTNMSTIPPGSGTLVFDDYQMSADIIVPVANNPPTSTPIITTNVVYGFNWPILPPNAWLQLTNPVVQDAPPNTILNATYSVPTVNILLSTNYVTNFIVIAPPGQIGVALGTPTLAPEESPDLMPPGLGLQNSTVRVLGHLGGISLADQASSSTNVYFYFERSTFRVKRVINDGTPFTASVWVYPSKAPPAGITYTVNYAIDCHMIPGDYSATVTPVAIRDQIKHGFTLQSGSDYAQKTGDGYDGTADFTDVTGGMLSWGPLDGTPKEIRIPITDKNRALFNEDLEIELFAPRSAGFLQALGQIATTTVTILYDTQPAGAVDRKWNADGMVASTPPYLQYPGAQGGVSDSANGNGGMVYSILEQPDGKAIIAGSFISYNSTPYNRIVRTLNNGYPDPNFLVSPNSGANSSINSMALQSDGKIIIAGDFTSFNGTSRYHVARLNSNGTVDTTFNPGLGADGRVWAVALQSDGKIVIGGEFQNYNGIPCKYLARLKADGSLDTGYLAGSLLNGNVYALALNSSGVGPQLYAAGSFLAVGSAKRGGLAGFNPDGSLCADFDPGIATFNPTTGNTDAINALAVQQDGRLLAGGSFSYVDMLNINGLARFNTDGTLDTTFSTLGTQNGTYNPLTYIADQVKAVALQPDGKILIGGDFTTFNQTRRVGIARLYVDGSVDTTFMDTAYNQFAGLINHYHNPDAVNGNDYPQGNHRNSVLTIAVEPGTTNVLIGGNFLRVGGGSYLHAYVNPQSQNNPPVPDGIYGLDNADQHGIINNGRMDIHPRSNVARLVGGSTGGPGNIGLYYNNYTVDKSAGTLNVRINRANGFLGNAFATFYSPPGVSGQQGVATQGTDFSIGQPTPFWATAYATAWMWSDGQTGINADLGNQNLANEILTINNNTIISGNLNANLALAAPDSIFQLGGEKIPLGVALGANQQSPMTIIDDNFPAGTFSFSSPAYTVNENLTSATITVTRTNGTRGSVQVSYGTYPGTAKAPANYTLTAGTLVFADGDTSKSFSVAIKPNTVSGADKTINLVLYSISGGGIPGVTNSVLTIVNNNYTYGHIAFAFATNGVRESAGTAPILVNRLGGGSGTIDVTYSVTNGTASSGVNFVGTTNILHWDNGDVAAKTITVPILHDGLFSPNLTANLQFTSAKLNNTNAPNVLGYSTITNTTLVITNVDFPGAVEFTSATYSVKKSAGFALVPVIRTGGSAGTITAGFTTLNNTALSGVDYTATNGVLTFTNGVVSQYIKVPINGGSASGPVFLKLAITNTPNSPSNATLNIIDTATVNEVPGEVDVTYNPNAGCNGNVYAVVLQTNNQMLVAGDFTMANGVPRQRIARLNADGSLDAGFSLPTSSMGADDQVRAMAMQTDGRIVLGGYFSKMNNISLNRIARLNYDGTLDSLFNPGSGADSPVNAVAETFLNGARKILVGGAFSQLNGAVVNGIGRLNDDGTLDGTFNYGGLGANGTVYAIAVQSTDGKAVIGGDFTQINGQTANHIARLNVDGSLDLTFTNASASDSVRALAIQVDGQILAGGLFTSFNNSTNFTRIARLNSFDGTIDSSFNPGLGANGVVLSIALQTDNRIILGGSFTAASGVTRNGITRLYPDGSVDPTINFGMGADAFVASVLVQQSAIPGYPANVPDEKLLIGGGFTHYNGVEQPHLARIYAGAMSGVGSFQFSAPTYSVNENGTNIAISIYRTGGTSGTNADGSGDVFVGVTLTNGTAQAGVNYSNTSTVLRFPSGEILGTVVVPVIDDLVITNDLTVNLTATPVTPATVGNQPTAVLTIFNVESAINFSSPTYLVSKYAATFANGAARIFVNRIGSTYGTSTVVFNTTTNGNAVIGSDYLAQTNLAVTFSPGISNQTVLIPIINGRPSGDLTVSLQLSSVSNSVLYSPTNAVLTIRDQTLAIGGLLLSATNYVVTEGGGIGFTNAIITVLRTNGSSGIVTVDYTTISGTAAANIKFTPTRGTLTFSDGEILKTIAVPVKNTATVEPTESFAIQLSNPTGGVILNTPTNAAITVLNTNSGIAFTISTNSLLETAGIVKVTVFRYNNLSGTATVDYGTTNGTAVSGVNFTAMSGTLTFSNNQPQYDILVPILYNTNVTGDLQFTMGLSNPTGGVQIGVPGVTTLILRDADTGLSFTTNATSVMKNGTNVVVTVICSNTNVEPVSVGFATADGTALAGVDYTGTNGTLTFSNGVSTQSITVSILKNTSLNGSHAFTVGLLNPTGTGRILAPSTNTVTILDSNSGLHFTSANYQANKTDGLALISVWRSEYTDTVSTVNFMATNGTAIAGNNFTATNGTLTFDKGVVVQTFTVPIIPTLAVQPDLTVLLQLSSPSNGVIDSPSAALLTIHDPSGSYVVPAGSQIISESGPVNGVIDSNETVTVLFAFRVAGGTNVNNLIATLLATNGVTPVGYATTNYGPMVYRGHSVSRPYAFTAVGTNQQAITATFLLQDTNVFGVTNLGLAIFNYSLGSWTTTFTNTAMIVINDNTNASPYPSVITVSQVGGSLIKATVTLNKLSHGSPKDVDALVVSPAGANTLLMAHAGSSGASATNLVLTFDDTAASSLPATGTLTSGTNKPTQFYPVRGFY